MDKERYKNQVERKSNMELSQWYCSLNARLDEPRNSKKIEDMRSVLKLIKEEWGKRIDNDNQDFIPIPEVGLLKVMGYTVGNKGLKDSARRRILEDVLVDHLPLVGSPEYMHEWGDPLSVKRFNKIKNCLLGFSHDRKHTNHKVALKDWKEDLDWLLENKNELI